MDYAFSDERWERIVPLLPGKPSDPGRTARDNRLFLDAVLWIARTGAPWPALPKRFGKFNSVFQRFNRWAKRYWPHVIKGRITPEGALAVFDRVMEGTPPPACRFLTTTHTS